MHHRSRFVVSAPRRGSALIVVIFLSSMMAILTASMLRYTITERRGNERNRLGLRAKNMSESISVYAAEQITAKLYRVRSPSPMAFMTGLNAVVKPPTSFLQAANPAYSSGTDMDVRAGLTSSTGMLFIDPATDPSNPNAGLQVNTATVPIVAKATAWHPSIGVMTAYTQHDLALDFVPLFQFAVFYNMDLEVNPGAPMTISGPVHTNGALIARCQTGQAATIEFTHRVSAAGGVYASTIHKANWYSENGTTDAGSGGTGPLNFKGTTGTPTNLYGGASNIWRDHKYGTAAETTTTKNNFKVFATTTYGINLRTGVHGVTPLVLPSVSNYSETNLPATPEDDRHNGRQVIARADTADTTNLKETKIARKAGLYIVVNPDSLNRTGYLPDGSAVVMRARSYRSWLNTVNSDGTHTIYEVVLPGQPSYGPLNANVNNLLPNRYRTDTSIGSNQVLRTIQGGGVDVAGSGYAVGAAPTLASFSDAYFWDLRRATNNVGANSAMTGSAFRATNPYTPRPVVKIDFDMTRFRMMVERTMSGTAGSYVATDTSATIYHPGPPGAGNWASSIFNAGAVPAAYNFGLGGGFTTLPTATTLAAPDPYRMYFAPANPLDPLITTDPGQFAVGASSLVSNASTKPWFDGIAVYLYSVDAEVRSQVAAPMALIPTPRIDSAVRLWNGRGPLVSLDGSVYPGKTGLTFATNDAAYIVGHYNANGLVNTTEAATGYGGYSAQYPDSVAEKLTAVMADAVTVLSQPIFEGIGYTQSGGWSDSLSAHRKEPTGTYTASWATTAPSLVGNRRDGLNTSIRPAPMPNLGNLVPGTGAFVTTKFAGGNVPVTEISTCLLVGIVPTNHNPVGLTDGPPSPGANGQTSGGMHNFPRLLEHWSNVDLFIRGSMVAMFESRVAMETFSLRVYTAPSRKWGLHDSLTNANHDLPLEPILLGARRLGFREITGAEYAAKVTEIEALPH